MKKKKTNKTQQEFIHYWNNLPDKQTPDIYVPKEKGDMIERRSQTLVKIFERYVNKSKKIIELGCNVGRNLNYLEEAGYKDLSGMEMQEKAIELMKVTYPKVYNENKIILGTFEDGIKKIKDNEYEVAFTMAVLLHIHPDSEWIFREIVRITKETIILVEDEPILHGYNKKTDRAIARKYKPIFEKLGCKQIYSERLSRKKGMNFDYVIRIFKKNG